MKKKEIFDNLKIQLTVEFFSGAVLSFITLLITYHFKGLKGLNEKAISFSSQIQLDSVNNWYISISTLIAIILFISQRFLNTKYNTILYKMSHIYFNTFITIYRLTASFLLGFSALYVTYEHSFSAQIGVFCFYGFISLFITAGLVILLDYISKRPERELKAPSGTDSH